MKLAEALLTAAATLDWTWHSSKFHMEIVRVDDVFMYTVSQAGRVGASGCIGTDLASWTERFALFSPILTSDTWEEHT